MHSNTLPVYSFTTEISAKSRSAHIPKPAHSAFETDLLWLQHHLHWSYVTVSHFTVIVLVVIILACEFSKRRRRPQSGFLNKAQEQLGGRKTDKSFLTYNQTKLWTKPTFTVIAFCRWCAQTFVPIDICFLITRFTVQAQIGLHITCYRDYKRIAYCN